MRAVLFDIDGTLLETDGAGKKAFSKSLDLVLGLQDPLDYIVWAGATDLGVLKQIMDRHQRPWPEKQLDDFFTCLGSEMDAALENSGATRLLHGVEEAVRHLHHAPHLHLGLLTGNGKASALQKVKHGGLLEYFNPHLGGYGDEHAHRPEIARRAQARLPDHGLEDASLAIIGDTPNDIEAARAVGARAIGVATGHYKEHELTQAGACVVFSDLSDASALVRAIEGV